MASALITLGVTAGLTAVQYLLAPKQKQQPIDKGKMDDIRIQGSDYGTYIPRTWGKTRIAGNLIFSNGIQHYVVTSGGGGGKKGRGQPQTNTHIYKSSVGVLVARNTISSFLNIWADADLLTINNRTYAAIFEAESGTLTGGAASYADGTASGGNAVNGLGNGGKVVFNTSSVSNPPLPRNDDPDEVALATTEITFYYKSATAKIATIDTNTISPLTVDLPATGSVWMPITIQTLGFATSVSYEYASAATADLDKILVQKFWLIEPADGPTVSGVIDPNTAYPADLDDPSAYYNYNPETAKNGSTGIYSMTTIIPGEVVRFYTGTETQTADATIKTWLDSRYGAGEGDLRASAMRGLSWVMFQDRTLKNNRVDNFTFETDTGDATVNTILGDLMGECGLTASDYTLTATNGLSMVGFLDHQKQSRKSLIESLERYFFFRIAEVDGKIITIADTFTSSATISVDSLRAHAEGEEMPPFDVEVIAKEEHLLPREARVSVMQPDLEYHNESMVAQLFSDISGKESKDYTFPIVDPASAARTVAEKLLLKEYSESTAYEFWGMPELARRAVGDVITIPVNGVATKIRIEKKQMTLPIGKIRIQGVSVNPFTPSTYQDDVSLLASKAASQYAPPSFPRNTVAFVISSLPIREADRGKLGVYVGICGRGRGDGNNASLYREWDNDNYVLCSQNLPYIPMGLCEDTLANHAGGTATEDTVNVLDIWFFDDVTLESVLQADIDRLPLVNLIRVGNEWVQFRTATVQTLEDHSPYRSKWRISNLWRGRFSTSAAISTHAAKEYAAQYTPQMYFFEMEAADIGQSVSIKAVTNGQAVDLAPISTFTFTPLSNYTVTNGTVDRSFDANNTSINELADVLATFIDDSNM